jgi:hypothetical protein
MIDPFPHPLLLPLGKVIKQCREALSRISSPEPKVGMF